MGGADGSRESAPDDKLCDTHRLHAAKMMDIALRHPSCGVVYGLFHAPIGAQ
jgi:hypothetical protein